MKGVTVFLGAYAVGAYGFSLTQGSSDDGHAAAAAPAPAPAAAAAAAATPARSTAGAYTFTVGKGVDEQLEILKKMDRRLQRIETDLGIKS